MTVEDIKLQMTEAFISNDAVIEAYELTPGKTFEEEFSTVSIESILFYCLAYGVYLLYAFFDLFKKETDAAIVNYTHPTLAKLAEKIKSFQYGDALIPERDIYNNTGLTDAQIAEKKIIKYASATEQPFSNGRYGVRLKLAGEDGNGNRVQLLPEQLEAAIEFWRIVKPGGLYTEITSTEADYLKLSLRVYYNPLVLNNQGQRLDGTDNEPLQKAIAQHLKNLSFNGKFNLTALVDAMQVVEGIIDPRILSAQTKYAALPFTDVVDEVVPDAGYLKIYAPSDLQINWIASV